MVCKLPVIQSRKLHRTPTLVHNLVLAGTFSIYHIVNGTLFRFNIQGQSLNLVLFMSQSCICFLCFCLQLLDRNLRACVLYVCNCLYFLLRSCLLCCSGCLCSSLLQLFSLRSHLSPFLCGCCHLFLLCDGRSPSSVPALRLFLSSLHVVQCSFLFGTDCYCRLFFSILLQQLFLFATFRYRCPFFATAATAVSFFATSATAVSFFSTTDGTFFSSVETDFFAAVLANVFFL